LSKHKHKIYLAAALPRYVIEVIAYAGIVAVTLAFVLKGEGYSSRAIFSLICACRQPVSAYLSTVLCAAITIKYHTKAVESLVVDLKTVRTECRSNPL
jgi:ATP-binding cassette, subfamily B, bacterial PglK